MRFHIMGGGCYGTFYARQLLRAADAGAIASPEIIVVDHNQDAQISREINDARVTVQRVEWAEFFDDYFSTLAADAEDHIVPPPFTPHIALGWLLSALGRQGPRRWRLEPFRSLPPTPFVHQAPEGPLNASHADWLCPVHCIEPQTCPHTRGPRDWDMADTARAFASSLNAAGQAVSQVHLFQCLHLTHGVGTYPAASVVKAFADLSRAEGAQIVRALVGTVSRCHGTMHLLVGTTGTDTVSPAHRGT